MMDSLALLLGSSLDAGTVLASGTAEQIVAEIRKAGGDLLGGVRLFDLYRGSQIPSPWTAEPA